MAHFTRSLALLLALGLLASVAGTQQELYVLGRFNKIWRVDGYDTASPVLVEITTWQNNGQMEPVGLERHPATGEFLLLTSPWNPQGVQQSELSRVDPLTGTTSVLCTFPFGGLRGLERRWDGTLLTLQDHRDLVRIDLATCTVTRTTLSSLVGSTWAPLALDARGMVVAEDGSLVQIDPIDGAVSSSGIPMPNGTQLGMEVDTDGTVYSVGAAADLWRFDPLSGQWTQVLQHWNVMNNGYDLAFSQGADGVGFQEVCEGLPNSTGVGATLELLGVSDVASNDLELNSRQLPPNRFGYYLMGPNAGSTPVGSGVLCIGPPVFRFASSVLDSGPDARVRFPLDLTQLPTGQPAMAGDLFLFQLWYRDAVGAVPTTNFSATVSVSFQ